MSESFANLSVLFNSENPYINLLLGERKARLGIVFDDTCKTLISAFENSGLSLLASDTQGLKLLQAAAYLIVIGAQEDSDSLLQDRGEKETRLDTVAPVERVMKAAEKLLDAMSDCVQKAHITSPTGQLNVSLDFLKILGPDEDFLSGAMKLHSLAAQALTAGVVKKGRGAPRNKLQVTRFISALKWVCIYGSMKIYDENGEPTPEFVTLVRDCMKVFPAHYQYKTERELKARVQIGLKA